MKTRRLLHAAGAVLLGAGTGLVLVEAGLRLLGVSYPIFLQADPVRGVARVPGASGRYGREGGAFVRINSAGLRGPERGRSKPPSTFRVAFLGDSMVEGLQVPLEQTVSAVVESELASCPALTDRRPEVIDFAVAGYGTGQELLTLSHVAAAWRPDLVLLGFFTGNDVADNLRVLKQLDHVPYFIADDGGTLTLDESFLASRAFALRSGLAARVGSRLARRLRSVQLLNHARYLAGVRSRKGRRAGVAAASGLGDTALLEGVYREPREPAWTEAWRVTELLLGELQKQARVLSARYLVVTLTNPVQIHPDPRVRREVETRLGIADLFYPERRVRGIGERLGFPVLALAPELQEIAERERRFLHGFGRTLGAGHWNEEGHRLAGRRIARWLCERLTAEAETSNLAPAAYPSDDDRSRGKP